MCPDEIRKAGVDEMKEALLSTKSVSDRNLFG